MSTDDKGYNGWTNYETWNMNLWIDNDEGSQEYALRLTQKAWGERQHDPHGFIASGVVTAERTAIHNLATMLKDWQEEDMPDLPASVWSDLLNAAFGEIDWVEIAEHYIEDVDKTDDREAERG